ncbi:hypothetical protein B0H17DRAFT_1196971 [Mycena rosella]|uniref:Uncharacterized protein n=1 Tax=Mycena rosella TaxID=1033263 RepID=A0AAD7DS23_MYCRO|nr:hypothetical protein B0H17DRAFT_1196971 [Mycena rosella]
MSTLQVWALRCPMHSFIYIRRYSADAATESPLESVDTQNRWSATKISTLNPSRIRPTDHIDLSWKTQAALDFPVQTTIYPTIRYTAHRPPGQIHAEIPFPARSRGFLYYQSDPHAALAGSIRFRLTTNDSSSRGQDLRLPSGFPWQISLAQMAYRSEHAFMAEQLGRERLVTPEELTRCRDLFAQRKQIYPQYTLFGLHSTFLVNFSRAVCLTVVGEALHDLTMSNLFAVSRNRYFPWTGSAVARFEPSVFPERRVIHMRIVEILEPVACKVDAANYTGRVLQPQEGQLLTIQNPSGISGPWAYDIDNDRPTSKVAASLRVLWDNSPTP